MERLCFAVLTGMMLAGSIAEAEGFRCRWVYVARGLHNDQDVEDIRRIVGTAAEHGVNGMVLSAGLDRLDLQPSHYFERLEAVKAICAERGVEIIPIIFSAGYGGSVLAHDRNLAAGLPVRDARYVVDGDAAHFAPDRPVAIEGGDFERHRGDRVLGCRFHDEPGRVSFVDTEVVREGKASLRFENFGESRHGHGRVMFEVPVRPRTAYRVTCFVKSDGLEPAGCFRIQVLTGARALAPWDPRVPSTADWRQVTLGFNSFDHAQVRIYAGVWGGRAGRFWIDDLRIEEAGPVNLLRRPGTPLAVRDEATGQVYDEGRDFEPVADARLNFRFDHEAPTIRLREGSRIRDGQALRLDGYQGIAIHRGQVSVCMSEPKLYEIWRKQAELMHRHLAPKRYLLSMDEIRAGGACQACKSRNLSMARILGDCITRQVAILRGVEPEAEVLVWSDMLDPNHNARDGYYLVDGDYSGSWEHVPRDLVIVCWYFDQREASLGHFSGLGFKTLAGAYYDGDTLDNVRGWLDALRRTPGAVGIMYTTWQNKYELLGAFGDLVNQGAASK